MHFESGYNLGLCSGAERHSQCQIRMFTLGFEMYSAEFRLSFDAKVQKRNQGCLQPIADSPWNNLILLGLQCRVPWALKMQDPTYPQKFPTLDLWEPALQQFPLIRADLQWSDWLTHMESTNFTWKRRMRWYRCLKTLWGWRGSGVWVLCSWHYCQLLVLQEASSPFTVQSWVRHQYRDEPMLRLSY